MACSKPCSKAGMQTFVSAGKSLSKPSLTNHPMVWMTPWYCSDDAVGLKSTHHLKMPTTSLWFGILVMFCSSCSIGCLCAGIFFRCQHGLEELLSNFSIRARHDELLVRVGPRLVAGSQVAVVASPHHDAARRVLVDALVLGQPRSEAVALEDGRVDLLLDSKGGVH